jgi:hypothetical protein
MPRRVAPAAAKRCKRIALRPPMRAEAQRWAVGVAVPNSFTQFLLQNDYASLAEIEEASQATVLYGGRVGTALIELGILAPDQLDEALGRFHGLAQIPAEWLARPDAGARAALHVDMIKRHKAFPLLFEKRSLHVGMLDPRDELVLDNLAFASGCLIVPYALAEFRFAQLMHRVFAVAPSARFRTLLDEGTRARAMRGRAEQRKRVADERAKNTELLEIGPLAADIELSDRDAFFVAETPAAPALLPLGAPPPPQLVAPSLVATPAPEPKSSRAEPPKAAPENDDEPIVLDRRNAQPSLEALERTLAECEERTQVIDTGVALAARFAEVTALFVIRDGMAAGLAAQRAGRALDVDATLIPIAADSVLARCHAQRGPERALPASALDKLLAKALRSDEASELAVWPIAIGERVVNLLVAQPASGAMSASAAAALGAVAPQIGGGYERLIRVQKQKAQAPSAPAPPAPAAQRIAPKPSPTAANAAATKAAIGALPLQKRVVKVPRSAD